MIIKKEKREAGFVWSRLGAKCKKKRKEDNSNASALMVVKPLLAAMTQNMKFSIAYDYCDVVFRERGRYFFRT